MVQSIVSSSSSSVAPCSGPSTSYSSLSSVTADLPPAELYSAALTRRLAVVRAMVVQAADASRSALARREAARLAAATLSSANELLVAWQVEIEFAEGGDSCSWQGQAIDAMAESFGAAASELRQVLKTLPAAAPRLARTSVPSSRRQGAA